VKKLIRWFSFFLMLSLVFPAVARTVQFHLEMWKEFPASYSLETSNYRNSKLIVRKRRSIDVAAMNKSGWDTVVFKPSKRQIIEAETPALMQPDPIDEAADEFLANYPLTMRFKGDGFIEMNAEKNIENVDKFFRSYVDRFPANSPVRAIKLDDLKTVVYMNSQMLLGLFVNPMLFSDEFEEGHSTHHFPGEGPIREADFDLRPTLYGYTLQGEAFVQDPSGEKVSKNTYVFEFSPELDVLNKLTMEVKLLKADARDVFVLTR
jgi:hypothetical protein